MEPTLIQISFFKQTKKSVSVSISLCMCVCSCVWGQMCAFHNMPVFLWRSEGNPEYPHLPPCLRQVLLFTIGYAMLAGSEAAPVSFLLEETTHTHCCAVTIPTRVSPLHSKQFISGVICCLFQTGSCSMAWLGLKFSVFQPQPQKNTTPS